MWYNKKIVKTVARFMLLTMGAQLVLPVVSPALTSGPSQPEVQSFEPVGTTDMVDLFTGDFVYNIPLLDIEGYPINISYHSGGDMEQEASWVGLGWNINPGAINRSVRGMPDDFDGEMITKELSIKPEKNVRVGLGIGAEPLGVGAPLINLSANLSLNLNVSNYRGVSADFSLGAGVNVIGMASAGVNMGVGSQSGADVDYNLGLAFNTSMIIGSDIACGVGFNFGHGYNTRTAVKDKNFGISGNVSIGGRNVAAASLSTTVPIGLKNIIPVITNRSEMTTYRGQVKLGGELFGVYGHVAVYGMVSTLNYLKNGSMKGFGYLYAEHADDASILDFTRDRDGLFNETMHYLPSGNMTYDIYSVSGQGTGGSFRPFRNDFGSVYDPAVSSTAGEYGVDVEVGIGNLFELGSDITVSHTDITSGPWADYKRPFTSRQAGSLYENAYFKQAGEATAVNPSLFSAIQGIAPITGTQTAALPLIKPGAAAQRDPRGNLIYYFTAGEAAKYGVASSQKLYSYTSLNGFATGPDAPRDSIDRVSGGRKAHHISEVVQVQTDGRRYIYGLPAMNNTQNELTFSTAAANPGNGLVTYSAADASASNDKGRDHYFSKTSTPAYAHSYLLTSVLSADYVDVRGDGITDDDFGSYTKFNYTRKNAAFHWKAPYGATTNLAQHNPGFKSDKQDDKASYLDGTREQWMLHSVESKNFVAEFYTSARDDARGVNKATDLSYKLDSIRLYNKHDRFLNTSNAVPVKTVMFQYDYTLCPGVPNSINGGGKLTLKQIYVRYGNSDRSMLSPYKFNYDAIHNYPYNIACKDRWGAYKPASGAISQADFPFVNQQDPQGSNYAWAWSLVVIQLPSGGLIKMGYETDDYAYVQDKVAMEMVMLSGLGNAKELSGGNQLYLDKDNPNKYMYFKRSTNRELPGLSFKDNYFKGQSVLYYNLNVRLVDNAYENIKGYAEIDEVGVCPNNAQYGYVKLQPMEIQGGGAQLHPATYTALNFARYYLPHIIFPGSDPDAGGLENVLAGLQYAFSELVSFAQNPVKRMVNEGKAREIKLASSFIRVNSPGLKKRGGGQRVSELKFSDHWSELAGGNTQDATYGKYYTYTTDDQGSYGTISSGVASYEPQIGGDENPFRMPVNYSVQSGSNWPPNDPVGVYQELPVGESLYPAPVVGYSRVTVKSIHQGEGRSSQGMDVHDFYTAKDFPIRALNTPLTDVEDVQEYSFTQQTKSYKAAQGYTLIFNDMHGKPKRTEHRIIKPATGATELVSYQQYNYFGGQGQLDNNVPVVEFDPASGKIKKVNKQVGIEADLTIDTREKKEETGSNTLYLNLNVFIVGIIPIPVPFWYDHDFNFSNRFRSVVATKVVQQYGLLKEVQSYQEGAVTTVRNEAFDPVTGQALITSVNNEFGDREYSVNYPAHWGYKSMGPSYGNTGYEEYFDSVRVEDHAAQLRGVVASHYRIGDELLISYTLNGQSYENNVWVMHGFVQEADTASRVWTKCGSSACEELNIPNLDIVDTLDVQGSGYSFVYGCLGSTVPVAPYDDCGNMTLLVKPRFTYSWPESATLKQVRIKVVRSGAKNQLNETIQQYTGMAQPFDGNNLLKDNLDRLIRLSARTYSDTLTAILPRYDSLINPQGWDSLNSYVNGTRQIKRLATEYAYLKDRDYSGNTMRNAGLFAALSLWRSGDYADLCRITPNYCIVNVDGMQYQDSPEGPFYVLRYTTGTPPAYINDFNYMKPQPSDDHNWVVARSITKWSPWGFELENKDALGNYTAAVYGYNQQLPVALARNARQQEVLAEGFEDYQLLQRMQNLATMPFSPFASLFSLLPVGSGIYGKYHIAGPGTWIIGSAQAHTGNYALATGTTGPALTLPLAAATETGQPRYRPFSMTHGQQYLISYWIRPKSVSVVATSYAPPSGMQVKSNIIEGWQQVERLLTAPATGSSFALYLPKNTYIDDIRIQPVTANMKAFVYHPVNQRLVATLDENNFASFYEYDQEGNLVRTKKETEKGIMTVTESRSAQTKSKP